jgi:hypothetical protein
MDPWRRRDLAQGLALSPCQLCLLLGSSGLETMGRDVYIQNSHCCTVVRITSAFRDEISGLHQLTAGVIPIFEIPMACISEGWEMPHQLMFRPSSPFKAQQHARCSTMVAIAKIPTSRSGPSSRLVG